MGLGRLAVAEAHGLCPTRYAVLGAAAQATTTLRLGTAVAIPLRHPLLAANAMATVQGMFAGPGALRARARGQRRQGAPHQSPMRVADFEATCKSAAGLSPSRRRRAERQRDVDGAPLEIDPSLDVPKPPLYIATGRRTLEVAARTSRTGSTSPSAPMWGGCNSIELARDACRAAGRASDEVELGCFVQVAVDRRARHERHRRSAVSR